MFDGAFAGERHRESWADEAVARDFARLCVRFDGLLGEGGIRLDREATSELKTLARIHDLNDALPPPTLWRALRAILGGELTKA